ncbi:fimbrial protein [Escherichia coli]|nr:fimbrial protein [Escherichia coli]
MKKKIIGIMLFSSLFTSISALAVDNLQFRGKLIIPNCTINNNQPFVVDWGDVEIQTFTSSHFAYHIKQVSIPMDCPYYYNTPKLTLIGRQGGGVNYIQTSKHEEGLAIAVRQGEWNNNRPVTLGQQTNIENGAISGADRIRNLNLSFALTRTKNIDALTPGLFTAGANIEVRYE